MLVSVDRVHGFLWSFRCILLKAHLNYLMGVVEGGLMAPEVLVMIVALIAVIIVAVVKRR